MKQSPLHRRLVTASSLSIFLLLSATVNGLAGGSTVSSEKATDACAHGMRTAKDLPKPLPAVVEAVNKTAVEAGKELSKAGQVVKDAANKAYKNIKSGTSK
jgi:hypothetical protein